MDKAEIVLLAGIITSLVWLGICIILEDKKRKITIIIGALIDIVLFAICRNSEMLFVGVLGGLACGVIPGFGSRLRKYETAVREMKGIKNWLVVSIILFIMIFMVMAIAYPELDIVWE